MAADKIIISFDDAEEPEKEKLEIEIKDSVPEPEPKPAVETFEKISSFPYGDRGYTLNSKSNLEFPSGIERGFGVEFTADLKQSFLNSILESGKYIILASVDGFINLVEKSSGKLYERFFFEGERFEKSGVVLNDRIYVNSIRKIYLIADNTPSVIPANAGIHCSPVVFYTAPEGFFIWSSLNEFNGNIIFTLFSPKENTGKIIEKTQDGNENIIYSFNPGNYISGEILAAESSLYTLFDNKICVITGNTQTLIENSFAFSYDVYSVLLNDVIYFNSPSGEIYTLDKNSFSTRFTGIRTSNINSIAASDDVIFTGTSTGWSAFHRNGVELYSHIDVDKNTLLGIGKNILAASVNNKIMFHNTAKFAEAQMFSLSDEIVSARVSANSVYVLTKTGKLESFKNDMLIIHI